MNLPTRIFLVGLPGAGKSTVGKYLAAQLGYSFIDLDDRIEAREGKSIHEIFNEQGETRFREIERDTLRAIADKQVVVATGGGAPCFHDNMNWMNANGLTVFLNPAPDVILARIAHQTHRPLLKGNQRKTLEGLMERRGGTYEQAHVLSDSLSADQVLSAIEGYVPTTD